MVIFPLWFGLHFFKNNKFYFLFSSKLVVFTGFFFCGKINCYLLCGLKKFAQSLLMFVNFLNGEDWLNWMEKFGQLSHFFFNWATNTSFFVKILKKYRWQYFYNFNCIQILLIILIFLTNFGKIIFWNYLIIYIQ